MNRDIFNKEIVDVTLRGTDIKRVFCNEFDTGNETTIRTRDKEYLVPDEGAEIYRTLNSKDKFISGLQSIKLIGKIRYRDLKNTKFVIVEESESSIDKANV